MSDVDPSAEPRDGIPEDALPGQPITRERIAVAAVMLPASQALMWAFLLDAFVIGGRLGFAASPWEFIVSTPLALAVAIVSVVSTSYYAYRQHITGWK